MLPPNSAMTIGKKRPSSRHFTAPNVFLKPAVCSSGCRGIVIDRHWDFAGIPSGPLGRPLFTRTDIHVIAGASPRTSKIGRVLALRLVKAKALLTFAMQVAKSANDNNSDLHSPR